MAKQTAAERKEAQRVEAEKSKVAAFVKHVNKLRRQHVVQTAHDVFDLGRSVADPLFGKDMEQQALYYALDRVDDARKDLVRHLDWLERAVADGRRYLAENYSYSSGLVQGRGADVDMASATLHARLEAAQTLCGLLNVYCPMLHSADRQARRAQLLSVEVKHMVRAGEGAPYYAVRNVADGNLPDGITALGTVDATGNYDTELAAWLAVMALVGGDR